MAPKAYSYLRMSTELQLKGDSRRRQLERSKRYAEEHGLDLASADQLEDIGISAFKGLNVKEGALGKFLTAVKAGSVEQGSYLLVESLDRISRQPILNSLSLFLDIIQSGINLVTLTDKKVFRVGETEFADLIISLTVLARAHEESAIKADRVSAAWKNKRVRAASGQPMTTWAPAWLKLSHDRKAYEVLPDRVEIVQGIYEDAAAGLGMYSIAARLNAGKVPTFSESNGWHQSYIAKILGNRAVLGEFQAGVRRDGIRVNEGDPIKNYYPAIVSNELFYRAQLGKAERRGKAAGRKGKAFANLFAGLATCAYCGSKVSYENKGTGPKGGAYLICDSAKRKLGCEALRWKYTDFEASFLAFVRELDLSSIVNAPEGRQKRAELDAEIEATRGELGSLTQLMEKTYALLSVDSSIEFVSEKLKSLQERKADLESRLLAQQTERADIEEKSRRIEIGRDEINALVATLQAAPTGKLFELRAHIASRLRSIVASLRVASVGTRPDAALWKTAIGEIMDRSENEMLQLVTRMASYDKPKRRYFAVGFENAPMRVVYPEQDNSLRYEMQVMVQKGIGFKVDRESQSGSA